MRALMRLVAVVGLALCGLVIGSRQIGTAQQNPAREALAVIRDADQPACWRDFCPGKVAYREAETRLRAANVAINEETSEANHRLCWQFKEHSAWMGCIYRGYYESFVWGVSITISDRSFRLGDAILLYGEPQDVQICGSAGSAIASLHFPNNLFVETAPLRGESAVLQLTGQTATQPQPSQVRWRLDPQLTVTYVYLSFEPFGGAPTNTDNLRRWKGFTRGRCSNDPAGAFDE